MSEGGVEMNRELILTGRKTQGPRRSGGSLMIATFGLVILVTVVCATGQAPAQQPLEQKSITICDDQGRVRIELALDPGGAPYIALKDEKGVTRAQLDANVSGPGIHLRDADNSLIASLRIRGESEPFLMLCAGDGEVRFRAP